MLAASSPMPDEDRSRDQSLSADPARWARAGEVFHAAVDLRPEQRETFLRTACLGDSRLREEVAALLACDEHAGDFIERPAAAILGERRAFTPRFSRGMVLGRYEILEFVGAGGLMF